MIIHHIVIINKIYNEIKCESFQCLQKLIYYLLGLGKHYQNFSLELSFNVLLICHTLYHKLYLHLQKLVSDIVKSGSVEVITMHIIIDVRKKHLTIFMVIFLNKNYIYIINDLLS